MAIASGPSQSAFGDGQRFVAPPARRAGMAGRGDTLTLAVVISYLVATVGFEIAGITVLMRLGSFDLNLFDVPFMLSAILAIGAVMRPKHATAPLVLGLMLALLMVGSLVRGVAGDTVAALVWLRANGFVALAVVIGLTARIDGLLERRIRTAFVVTSLILSVVLLLRLTVSIDLFAIPGSDMVARNEGRALSVHGVMMMVAAAMMLLSASMRERWRGAPGRTIAFFVISGASILSGQGTAGICLAIGVVMLLALESGPSVARRIVGLGFGGLLILFVTLVPPELYMTDEMERIVINRGRNRGFRQYIWEGFTNYLQQQDLVTQMFGPPAGQHLLFFISPPGAEQMWDKSLHSMYYGQLATTGYLGLIVFVVMIAVMLAAFAIALARRVQAGFLSVALGFTLTVQAALLGYSYEVRSEALLLLLLPWLIGRSMPPAFSGHVARPGRRLVVSGSS